MECINLILSFINPSHCCCSCRSRAFTKDFFQSILFPLIEAKIEFEHFMLISICPSPSAFPHINITNLLCLCTSSNTNHSFHIKLNLHSLLFIRAHIWLNRTHTENENMDKTNDENDWATNKWTLLLCPFFSRKGVD